MAPNFVCGLALICFGISSVSGKSFVAVERIREFLNEDSDIDTTAAFIFLSTVLQTDRELSDRDGTDLSDILQKCEHGQCKECKNVQGAEVCVVAKIIGNGFSVDLTVQGKTLLDLKVDVPNPKPVCMDKIPGLPMVKNACLIVNKVDLAKKSACVEVSATVAGRPVKVPLGCFTIPTEDTENSDIDTTAAVLFLSTVLQTDRELSDRDGTDLSDILEKCEHGQCKECKNVQGAEVCVVAKIIGNGFSVDITVQGKTLLDLKVDVPNPKPVCTDKIPGLPMVKKACLIVNKVDLAKKSACVEVSATIAGMTKTIPLGCFTIPTKDTETPVDIEEFPVEVNLKELDDLSMALTLFGLDEVGPDDLVGKCKGGKCSFCLKKFLKVCVMAEETHKGFKLTLTFKDKVVFQREIDVSKPCHFCIGVVPGIPSISKLCVQIDHIDIKEHSACVSVSFQVKPFRKFAFKVGCFHIPTIEEVVDQTVEVELL